jgi:hypothetical protein
MEAWARFSGIPAATGKVISISGHAEKAAGR